MNRNEWDVLVIGGGTAGLLAGISAARNGASTLIIEASGFLGGNAAFGMTYGGFYDIKGCQVVRGLPQEFVERAIKIGSGLGYINIDSDDTWISGLISVDPETVKYLAIEMIREAKCDVWLRSSLIDPIIENKVIEGARVLTKQGIMDVYSKCIIDATGDGDFAARAGCRFEQGGEDDQQLISTMFRISNVDIDSLENYMNEVVNVDGKDAWKIGTAPLRASFEYWLPWKFDESRNEMPHLFGVYHHGNPGDIVINAVGVNADALNIENISWAEMELRKRSTELFWYLRDNVSGFEKSFLSQVYPLGVRESRRIIGDYTITLEDITSGREYKDVIAMGAYPPDLHSSYGHVHINREENLAYQIPYRATLPAGIDGVIVAGRCISATFKAQSGLRGIGPSMSVGQAVGLAAALAAKRGIDPRAISIEELQSELLAQGVYLGEKFVSGE